MKDNKKTISVIVPVYNAEKFLQDTVNSIRNQTYENLEIILVNDGSLDDSINVAKKLAGEDSRVKVLDKENGGVGSARNAGIEAASGEYIAFVDADDKIEPIMIESLYAAAVSWGADIVRGKAIIHEKDDTCHIEDFRGLENTLFSEGDIPKLIEKFIVSDQAIACFSGLLLVKKEVADRFSVLPYMEDAVFYVKTFLKAKAIYLLDEPIYHYVYNASSASRNSEKVIRNIFSIIEAESLIKEALREKGILTGELEKRINTKGINLIFARLKILSNLPKVELTGILKKVFTDERIAAFVVNQYEPDMTKAKKIQRILIRNKWFGLLAETLKKSAK